jgi:hypothetical protein
MDLKAAPVDLELKLGLQLADSLKADVTERTNKVREHDEIDRHDASTSKPLYDGPARTVKTVLEGPPGQRRFLAGR